MQITKDTLPRSLRSRFAEGFSMIEILVAITILMIMVVLVSMVFQQSNDAFSEGRKRNESQIALRSVLGSISRDLSLAVDSALYPSAPKNQWGAAGISFLAVTGSGETEDDRVLQRITYSFSAQTLKRSVQKMSYNAGKWSGGAAGEATTVNSLPLKSLLFSYEKTVDGAAEGGSDTLPAVVSVEAVAQDTTLISGAFGGWSSGPDGQFGTKDDVKVGALQNGE